MAKLLSLILVMACLWATVDVIQSKLSAFKKALWIASLWLLSPIAVPFYIFYMRKKNQSNVKLNNAAWGGIIGLMFAGPLGAIAGAYLGHTLGKTKEELDSRSVFQINLISILSYVVKADGQITRIEIETVLMIFKKLGFGLQDLAMMSRAFESALKQDIDLKRTCENFKNYSRYEERLMLLNMVYMVVMADQRFHIKEKGAIDKIVDFLGIRSDDHMSIQAEYHKGSDQYYEILGLSKGASMAEVKKAYRNLALTHHPDRVGHLGYEYRKIAEEKFKKISEAYQIINQELTKPN